MPFYASQQARLTAADFDPETIVGQAMIKAAPWDSIIDFATHPSFCGIDLYPRQRTLLRLAYLETEQMTDYDRDVIEEWRGGFSARDAIGVQPDIWDRVKYLQDNGYRRFPHIQAVMGRRAWKGLFGAVLGTEQIAYFFSLDNWQAHYGIIEDKDGYLSVVATTQAQAKRHQFRDIASMVEHCTYLQGHIASSKDYELAVRTPGDMRRLARLQSAGITPEHEIASLRAIALSTISDVVRGAAGFANFYDEAAHFIQTGSSKSGEEIYEAGQPALDQFGKDALTYLPSSPFSKIGFFFRLYEEGSVLMRSGERITRDDIDVEAGLEEQIADPEMLIIQLPSWGAYLDWERGSELVGTRFPRPIQWPPQGDRPENQRMARLRLKNPDKFRVEREGQFAPVIGAYLDADKVDDLFKPLTWRPPLVAQRYGKFALSYRAHCDPGRTGANFALCIGHTEIAPCDHCATPPKEQTSGPCLLCKIGTYWPHVIIDLLHVWKPQDFPIDPETGKATIDYVMVQNDLENVLSRFMSTSKMSFDQWNSAGMIAALRAKFSPGIRVGEVTFTEKENQIRWERLKSAINLGWVTSYEDHFYDDGTSLLRQELLFLSEKNTPTGPKVIKQDFGPVTTKDLADSFAVVTTDLLHQSLDRWTQDQLTAHAVGSTYIAGLKSGSELERAAQLGVYKGGHRAAGRRAQEQMDDYLLARRRGRQHERRYSPGVARPLGRPERRFWPS